ncbi:MAG: BMP family ABC transporter substrate-binding protein [Clostridiaceae bacterium]
MNKRIKAVMTSLVLVGSIIAGCTPATTTTTAAGTTAGTTAAATTVAGTTTAGTTAAGTTTPTTTTGKPDITGKTVGMSTDEGGKGDKSFNDAGILGLDNIKKDFGLSYDLIETKDPNQIQQNLETIVAKDEFAVTVGFKMADAVTNVAKENPEKMFLLVDGVVDSANVKNVLFKENEGSFLLGVIAGMMTKTNKVGFIGGIEGEVIGRFESGFAAGVASVNPEAGKLLVPQGNASHGEFTTYAGSFSDIGKGKEIALDMYNRGADIVYHAAGGVGLGLFDAAQEVDKYAMGVDSDQALIIPDKADVILVSMMKRVDVAVYDAVKSYIDGTFKGGTDNLGLKEDAVGLSETIHPDLKAKPEILAKVEEYKAKIVDGTLVVPGTPEELKTFKVQ